MFHLVHKTPNFSISLYIQLSSALVHLGEGSVDLRNEAFQIGRHAEAVEHYAFALSCNVESRGFAAICYCNRALAYNALGQVTDAIVDCSLVIALDGNYLKALCRRITQYEMIRDYA
ncbi:hypothetical protein RIF29_15499 [Crotalaria pallida]|uniref:Uncharacterized protein n=1 Tax=Crotalaria pallida TaxID=3830 RepID=A0AAN9FLX5_CROPI